MTSDYDQCIPDQRGQKMRAENQHDGRCYPRQPFGELPASLPAGQYGHAHRCTGCDVPSEMWSHAIADVLSDSRGVAK